MDSEAFWPFKFSIKLHKAVGLWPTKSSPLWYLVYGVFMQTIFQFVFIVLMILYCVFEIREFQQFIDSMSIMMTYFATCTKLTNFAYHFRKVEKLLESLESLIQDTKLEEKFWKQIKRDDRIFRFFKTGAFLTCVIGFIEALMDHKLTYPTWIPFEYKTNDLVFLSILFYQLLQSGIYSVVTVSNDSMPVLSMSYTCYALDSLNERLENIKKSDKKSKNNGKVELLNCIKYHMKILEIVGLIKSCYSHILITQGLVTTVILCTTAYALTVTSPSENPSFFVQQAIYMVIMLLQIFLPCYYGAKIENSSKSLSTSLFHSEWFSESPEYKTSAMIFMEFAKNPLKIEAAGVFHVDLVTFGRICNSAYSMFAVFKNVAN